MYSYRELIALRRKGFRNGSWRRLNFLERMYFKVSISYAKLWDKIVNSKVIAELESIIRKLIPAFKEDTLRVGFNRARKLIRISTENKLFEWAPEIIEWLQDPKYILWLGISRHEGSHDP
jgi:hypothetical protein